MTVTIQQEISTNQLIEMIQEANFEDKEKMEIIKALFPSRSHTDRSRLLGDLTEFIYLNTY